MRNQFYYHAFLRQQPDLNWRNPLVVEEMHVSGQEGGEETERGWEKEERERGNRQTKKNRQAKWQNAM